MRKLLFLAAATGLTLPAMAQTERGAKLIGVSVGNVRYTRFNYGDRKEFAAGLQPTVGWFVANNFMVGAGLDLGYEGASSELVGTNTVVRMKSRSKSLGLLPQVRYYLPFGSKHRLFAHLSGGLTRSWARTEFTEGSQQPSISTSKQTARSVYGGLGYNYFLSPNVALEAQAGYRRSNDLGLSVTPRGGVSVRLGLSVFLPSGKAPATTE